MSHSTLYGITENLYGETVSDYRNSWTFSPAIWGFLEQKYHTHSMIGFHGHEGCKEINTIMNKGENLVEQICWELSNQQVFCVKDKDFVADCIDKFIDVARLINDYDVERFNTVANDIRGLDTSKYKFFVFKNTSVDDTVENWFYKQADDDFSDCNLLESNYFENELIVIDQINKCVTKFVTPQEFKSMYRQYI